MVVVPAAAALELLAAQRAGIDVGIAIGAQPRRSQRRTFARRRLLVAGARVRQRDQAGRRGARRRARDGRAGHGLATARRSTAPSTGRAARRRRWPVPRRCSRRCGPRSTAPRSRACSSGTRSAATRRRSRQAPASSGSARRPSARSRPSRRRSGSGSGQGKRWHATRTIVVRNVSTRTAAALDRSGRPTASRRRSGSPSRRSTSSLRVGRARRVRVTVTAPAAPNAAVLTGAIQVAAAGSETAARSVGAPLQGVRAEPPRPRRAQQPLVQAVRHEPRGADIQAGTLVRDDGLQIQPVCAARRPALLRERALSRRAWHVCATSCRGRTASGSPAAGRRAPARGGKLRAARRSLADAAAERETEQSAGLVPDRVASALDGHRGPRVTSAREPVPARPTAALQGR